MQRSRGVQYVIAISIFAVLCGLWVVVQLMAGRAPRACKGDGSCEREGLRSCKRGGGSCALSGEGSGGDVVPASRITRERDEDV